jgi:hypothetical protein
MITGGALDSLPIQTLFVVRMPLHDRLACAGEVRIKIARMIPIIASA